MCAFEVVGIGSAWVDRIAYCSRRYLSSLGLNQGQVYQVDSEKYKNICHSRMDVFQYAGGSVANSLVALSQLSHHVGFVGKASVDGDGLFFANDLKSHGVSLLLPPSNEDMSTSGCLYFESEGGEVTKVVHLGVSKTLGLQDMSMKNVIDAKFLLVEADILDMPKSNEWLSAVFDLAKKNCTKIILVLSNKYVVSRHRQFLLDLLTCIDFIAGNELEFEVLLDTQTVEKIKLYLSHLPLTVVMTRGSEGSCVFNKNEFLSAQSYDCRLVDSVSAGDYYLAGFLHACLEGLGLQQAMDLGSLLASKICTHRGSRFCDGADLKEIANSFLLVE